MSQPFFDVFISYSRQDVALVRDIVRTLEDQQITVWFDSKDIPPSTEFLFEIEQGIAISQAVICVISPPYVTSEICTHELTTAIRLGKRVIPIMRHLFRDNRNELLMEVRAALFEKPWAEQSLKNQNAIAKLNYLFLLRKPGFGYRFDQESKRLINDSPNTRDDDLDDFLRVMQALVEVVKQNPKEAALHTRITARAAEWEARSRDFNLLLRGSELKEAEEWLLVNLTTELVPSALVLEYVQYSKSQHDKESQEEVLQRRRELQLAQRATRRLGYLIAVLAVFAIVVSGLLIIASNAADLAQRSAATATTAQGAAQFIAATAVAERERADTQTSVSESRRVALQGLFALSARNFDQALLLSVGALILYNDTFEARSSLLTALQTTSPLRRMYHEHDSNASARVQAVAISPDGQYMASADDNGRIVLWDGRGQMHILQESGDEIWALDFSPDSRLLAVGGEADQIVLWDVDHVQIYEQLGDFSEIVFCLRFSPDGDWLAVGMGKRVVNQPSTVQIIDVASHQLVTQFENDGYVYAVAFHPESSLFAFGGECRNSVDSTVAGCVTLMAYEGESFRMTKSWQAHSGILRSLAFAPNRDEIVTGSISGQIRFWNAHSGALLASPAIDHTGAVRVVRFSPDGTTLMTGSADGTIVLRSPTTGEPLEGRPLLLGHTDQVLSAAFSPDSGQLLSGGNRGEVLLWSLQDSSPFSWTLHEHEDAVYALTFDETGQFIYSGSLDGTVRRWRLSPSPIVTDVITVDEPVSVLALDATRHWLAVGTINGQVELWDTFTHTTVRAWFPHPGILIRALDFSPNARWLMTADDQGTIQIWNVEDGTTYAEYIHVQPIRSADFSADSQRIAFVDESGQVSVWRPESGEIDIVLANSELTRANQVRYNSDGSFLAIADRVGGISLMHESDYTFQGTLTGHTDTITSVAFSADGRFLISGSRDETFRLWDILAMKQVGLAFQLDQSLIRSVAFSPDNHFIVAGAENGSIQLTSINVQDWIRRACQVANRELSSDEWQQYFMISDRTLCTDM